jgi:hypothetical protein
MRVPVSLVVASPAWHRGKDAVRPLLTLALAVFVAGCAPSTTLVNKQRLPESPESNREHVLLMPVDIELSELTAGGLLEPNAAWTATAKSHVDQAMDAMVEKHGAAPIRYRSLSPNVTFNDADLQVVKLHEAVGNSILLHKYNPQFALPTKKDKFDWSLGEDVAVLQRAYRADYAVFIYLRDRLSSGGRIAAMILVAALTGYAPQGGGTQAGFASLVDLNTGEVIWFNRLIRGAGDLREEASAEAALKLLFKDFPL